MHIEHEVVHGVYRCYPTFHLPLFRPFLPLFVMELIELYLIWLRRNIGWVPPDAFEGNVTQLPNSRANGGAEDAQPSPPSESHPPADGGNVKPLPTSHASADERNVKDNTTSVARDVGPRQQPDGTCNIFTIGSAYD